MQFLIFLLSLVFLVKADMSLSDLQPIAEFSDSCTETYETSIKNCDSARFAPFTSSATCSKDCKNELNSLSGKIQQACRGDGVKPNTVIAHAFQGDLANWLCASGVFSTSSAPLKSGTATNALATKTSSISSSSSASEPASTSSSSETESSTNTQQSTSSSLVSTTSTSLIVSSTLSTSATRASVGSSSTRSQPLPTRSFDSTPFDQTVVANSQNQLLVEILIPALSAVLCICVGSWAY